MTSEEYHKAIMDIVYLDACAVNGMTPASERVRKMDIANLYNAAEWHLLTGITAMALESAGIKDDAFTEAKGKAIRKVAAFDLERMALFNAMEKAGIWYMPLKGAVLKGLYPKIGMRQMSDNDILYDASRAAEVRTIMESLGFSTEPGFGLGAHDSYYKQPVCNFEMHRTLFAANPGEEIRAYYENVKDRLQKDSGSEYAYHFSDDDFYVYMMAHEYKHYSGGGTGLRSLLDTYVFLKKHEEGLDWEYVSQELEKLGIKDFECKNRSLALHLLGEEPLSIEDNDMLEYIISSGTYGTVNNRVANGIEKKGGGLSGKIRYFLTRVFLPLDIVRAAYPTFIKYPVLLPFLPVYRAFIGLTVRRRKMSAEIKAIVKHKK